MEEVLNYRGGALLPAGKGRFLDNFEPATGKVYSKVPQSDADDVASAVAAAKSAWRAWSRTPARERADFLRRIAQLISDDRKQLARAESIDTGKPLSLALAVDIPRSALNFEFFADAITQFSSECHATEGGILNYTLRQPLGVVACISPWNLPLYLLTWKIAPALAAGNCVVAKPSEITPMTAFLLSQICVRSGLPPGVLNIIHGSGEEVGSSLCIHPDIKAISFTGSTPTGAKIAQGASSHFKKLSLEMGGKNPFIVFADAPLGEAVEAATQAAFSNQGQICLCGSRIFVESSVYEDFRSAMVNRVGLLQCGDPLASGVDQGAVVSQAHFDKILSYVDLAKREGGRVLIGGRSFSPGGRCEHGWFIEPTLIDELGSLCRTNQEEIFGPVATLIPFDSEETLIREANGIPYGLAASLWTSNLSRAHRLATELECGVVWINSWMLRDLRTPFGGMKASGMGREGGFEALRFFTEPKNVCLKF